MNLEEQKKEYEEAISKKKALFDVNPVIVTDAKKIVLVKRIDNVQEGGKWSMPGSKVFEGERITETLKRIAKLKTGLDIEMISGLKNSLVGVYDNPKRDPREHVVGLTFECEVIGGELKMGGNSSDIGEFTEEEIKNLDLAFDHRENLDDFFNN